MARRLGAVLFLTLVVSACGGDAGSSTTTTTTPAPASTSSTSPPTSVATPQETVAPAPPAVVSLTSGRGDDDSLEVGVWFASDPFSFGDHRVVVGVDADESFPGTGDPLPHLDGLLEITPDGATMFEGSTVIGSGSDLGPLVSWGYAEGVLRVFFIGTVPPKAGTVWVIVETGGVVVTGGAAGTPFGTACSYHDAGLGLPPVGGDVPDPGTPCRYPLG